MFINYLHCSVPFHFFGNGGGALSIGEKAREILELGKIAREILKFSY